MFTTYYTYNPNAQTTNRIEIETCKYDGTQLGNFEYTYYPNGNVSKVSIDKETSLREYFYDEHDRLTAELDCKTCHKISYVYDNNGNVISKTIMQLSEEAIDDASNQYYAYTYDGDKLTKVTSILLDETSENEISYDNLGNITGYKDNTITWQGQRAVSINGIEMQYDYNGLRTRKGERYYYWLGNTLKMERWGENTIYYYYDESGVSGFRYNNTDYYYHKNIFGDVIAIYDKNKDLQATYEYDAWGNHKIYNQNGAEINKSTIHIGNINPIRYRGYYYDVEFGLYYLQSRYYSPELCRFISPDDVSYLDPTSINGLNLYAYCGNNPVMGYDPYGTFDLWEFFRGVGNIVTGAFAIGVGTIVLIGGAPIGMLIVAGITVGAGVLTLNNGIADTVGSFTGYNYMSDGLFNGNTAAYNWYSGITSTVAGIGTYICGNFIKTEYFMRGATPGTEGKMTLQPGMELDRYGSKYGRFLTNPGTAPGQLNLPASNNLVLNHYKVLKPFKVATGIVDGGGGFQYFTWRSVHRLIQMRYLAII